VKAYITIGLMLRHVKVSLRFKGGIDGF